MLRKLFNTVFKVSAVIFGGGLIYTVGKQAGKEEARKSEDNDSLEEIESE